MHLHGKQVIVLAHNNYAIPVSVSMHKCIIEIQTYNPWIHMQVHVQLGIADGVKY